MVLVMLWVWMIFVLCCVVIKWVVIELFSCFFGFEGDIEVMKCLCEVLIRIGRLNILKLCK